MTFLTLFSALCVGVISYRISHSALTNQISSEKTNTLVQARNTVDIALKEIEKSFLEESINPQLIRFVSAPRANEYENLRQTIKELVRIKNYSKNIFSIYVYMPKNNMIITTEDGFWEINKFYDLSWKNYVNINNGGGWIKTRQIKTFSGETPNVITYTTSIPFDEEFNLSNNLLVVNMYEKEI